VSWPQIQVRRVTAWANVLSNCRVKWLVSCVCSFGKSKYRNPRMCILLGKGVSLCFRETHSALPGHNYLLLFHCFQFTAILTSILVFTSLQRNVKQRISVVHRKQIRSTCCSSSCILFAYCVNMIRYHLWQHHDVRLLNCTALRGHVRVFFSLTWKNNCLINESISASQAKRVYFERTDDHTDFSKLRRYYNNPQPHREVSFGGIVWLKFGRSPVRTGRPKRGVPWFPSILSWECPHEFS
jgi:hypothetical protein